MGGERMASFVMDGITESIYDSKELGDRRGLLMGMHMDISLPGGYFLLFSSIFVFLYFLFLFTCRTGLDSMTGLWTG